MDATEALGLSFLGGSRAIAIQQLQLGIQDGGAVGDGLHDGLEFVDFHGLSPGGLLWYERNLTRLSGLLQVPFVGSEVKLENVNGLKTALGSVEVDRE